MKEREGRREEALETFSVKVPFETVRF